MMETSSVSLSTAGAVADVISPPPPYSTGALPSPEYEIAPGGGIESGAAGLTRVGAAGQAGDVPDAHAPVHTGRGDEAAIGTESHALDAIEMAPQGQSRQRVL